MQESKQHGGARPGAGRPRGVKKDVRLRLHDHEHQRLAELGGSGWVAEQLVLEKAVVRMTVDTRLFTEDMKKAFLKSWKDAGGYMSDLDSETPMCEPWKGVGIIEVTGHTAAEMGADYWRFCKQEIEALLKGKR